MCYYYNKLTDNYYNIITIGDYPGFHILTYNVMHNSIQ